MNRVKSGSTLLFLTLSMTFGGGLSCMEGRTLGMDCVVLDANLTLTTVDGQSGNSTLESQCVYNMGTPSGELADVDSWMFGFVGGGDKFELMLSDDYGTLAVEEWPLPGPFFESGDTHEFLSAVRPDDNGASLWVRQNGVPFRSIGGGTIEQTGEIPRAIEDERSTVSFTFEGVPLENGATLSGQLRTRLFTYDDSAAAGSGGGGGSCPITGDDNLEQVCTEYAALKQQCSDEVGLRACHCSAAALYSCYYRNGCYAEAGAATALTGQELLDGYATENQKACDLGTCCAVTPPQ